MKSKPNQKRRAGTLFNGVDKATGYAIRFEQAKDGGWGAAPDAFMAICGGRTLKQVKKLTSEAIQIHLEHARENGLPIPAPENGSILTNGSTAHG